MNEWVGGGMGVWVNEMSDMKWVKRGKLIRWENKKNTIPEYNVIVIDWSV